MPKQNSTAIAIRLSECRSKILELNGLTEMSDAQQTELESTLKEMKVLEVQFRSAKELEQSQRQENEQSPEYRNLIGAAKISDVVLSAAGSHRETATSELQQERGLDRNQVPLSLLNLGMQEHRAVTPAPTNTAQNQQEIVQYPYVRGDLDHLMIPRESVPSGTAVYPVLTSAADVKTHSDSTSVSETTGSFTAPALAPERSQASFFFRRVDSARFPMMESALRQALSEALSENLDALMMAQFLATKAAGGLGDATDLASGHAAFGDFQKLAGANVDGRYAASKQDVRVLLGSASYAHADASYVTSGEHSALQVLQMSSGGVRVSPHIAAVASKKQTAIVRLGARRDALTVVWEGPVLIYDEVTKAGSGEISVTGVLMSNRAILRTAAFKRIAIQVQA